MNQQIGFLNSYILPKINNEKICYFSKMEINSKYRGKQLGLYLIYSHEYLFNPYYQFDKYILHAVDFNNTGALVKYYNKAGFEVNYNNDIIDERDDLILMVKNISK